MINAKTTTRPSENVLTRRQMLQSVTVAALAVTTSPMANETLVLGEWREDLRADTAVDIVDLIEAHKRTTRTAKALSDRYDVEWAAADLPEIKVVIAYEHHTREPAYSGSRSEIRQWAEQCSIGVPSGQLTPSRQIWLDTKYAELDQIEARRREITRERGLDALYEELELAEQADYDAWSALINTKPAGPHDAAERVRYLLSLPGRVNDEQHPLSYWIEEFLTSLLPDAS